MKLRMVIRIKNAQQIESLHNAGFNVLTVYIAYTKNIVVLRDIVLFKDI